MVMIQMAHSSLISVVLADPKSPAQDLMRVMKMHLRVAAMKVFLDMLD
jgi:hypothetical protein